MVLIALGGNVDSLIGPPELTFRWALEQMAKNRLRVNILSPLYTTAALGQQEQPDYLNGVVRVQTSLPAPVVLKILKSIERQAGRNTNPLATFGRWGPRPLDLDIIDYKGRITQGHVIHRDSRIKKHAGRVTMVARMRQEDVRNVARNLILPHPLAHERPFVMGPLAAIQPFWHHPVLKRSALSLWKSLQSDEKGQILTRIKEQSVT